MTKDPKQPSRTPLGRAYRLTQLPGWFEKWLDVPPGRLGVVVEADGAGRTLTAGRHRLLTVYQRLRGQGVGLAAGYVPPGEFTSLLKVPCLLSGDGELLDLDLTCVLGMADAIKFFTELVLPAGEIWSTGLVLDQETVQNALNAVTARYAAADLVRGLPPRLVGELHNSLMMLVEAQGLELRNIQLVVFSRPEDRLKIAEKTQALKERLQDVELQSRMAAIETQGQLEEFIQQLDPELKKVANIQVNSAASAKGVPATWSGLGETLRGWFGAKSDVKAAASGGRMADLFRQKNGKQAPGMITHRPRPYWWLKEIVYIGFAAIIAILLTLVINAQLKDASLTSRVEKFLVPIWSLFIAVTLACLRDMFKTREKNDDAIWMLEGHRGLYNLVGNDRRWADELVREQSRKELLHVKDILQEIRTREYKRGKTEMALKLRNDLEKHAEECADKIARQDFARPPYVTDLKISWDAWNHMLDYDEGLLVYANGLSNKAQLLQQKSHTDELDLPALVSLDAGISAFTNQFFERGRPLKNPTQESNQ